MMCVQEGRGEREGERERERGVMMYGYEKTVWYTSIIIVLTTHTTPCTQITA